VRHRLGTALVVIGAIVLAYAATTYFWRDPVTDVYTKWKQHTLASRLDREFASYDAPKVDWTHRLAAERAIARAAADFDRDLKLGQPLGRIVIPKIDSRFVFVQGSDDASIKLGPGHYVDTALPGEPGTVGIAGHRTTYLAPFRHIDQLRPGDRIDLVMPYGTFTYRVVGSRVVSPNDVEVLRDAGDRPRLVLTACTPLYSAAQRLVVTAVLSHVASRAAGSRVSDHGLQPEMRREKAYTGAA
jgi:sortase A